jgi:hypothetical protein
LFAGIVTAFVIESSKDLKEGLQEQILKEILFTLRNDQNSSPSLKPFQLEAPSLHVNVLWFTSLTLVLASALWGFLAKGWADAYTPASNKTRTNDACERHLRSIRAVQWKVELALTLIPIFIQFSLFLFFAGLIIQLVNSNAKVSIPVVAIIVVTMILYILSTSMAPFFPAFPFHTQITSFIDDKSNRKYSEKDQIFEEYKSGVSDSDTRNGLSISLSKSLASWFGRMAKGWKKATNLFKHLRYKPGLLEMQSEILASIIAKTPDKRVFLEAARVIGSTMPTETLQKALVKSKARGTLYIDLQRTIKFALGISSTVDDADHLESVLFALIQIEQPLSISQNNKPGGKHPFLYMLKPGNVLHRWDNFEPYLWPLMFSLRIHILISSNEDDRKDRWDQAIQNLILMSRSSGKAFVRKILLIAAVRGLLVGRKNIQQACVIVLSEQLTRGRYASFILMNSLTTRQGIWSMNS